MIYELFWKTPLRILYLHGPSLAGYGFWANKQSADICSEITSVSATHWQLQPEMCSVLIDDHFESFHVGVTSLVYFSSLFLVTIASICHCFCIRPITNKLTL